MVCYGGMALFGSADCLAQGAGGLPWLQCCVSSNRQQLPAAWSTARLLLCRMPGRVPGTEACVPVCWQRHAHTQGAELCSMRNCNLSDNGRALFVCSMWFQRHWRFPPLSVHTLLHTVSHGGDALGGKPPSRVKA